MHTRVLRVFLVSTEGQEGGGTSQQLGAEVIETWAS